MPCTAADLVQTFDLKATGADSFIGHALKNGWRRIYGGQVLAQALVAAERTVEGKTPHSIHAYFILGGDPLAPIEFEVDRIRDGRSFATRRVVARQRGAAIFALSASFHIDEAGLEFALPAPIAPPPETLPSPRQLAAAMGAAGDGMRGFMDRILPIEMTPIDLKR